MQLEAQNPAEARGKVSLTGTNTGDSISGRTCCGPSSAPAAKGIITGLDSSSKPVLVQQTDPRVKRESYKLV